MHHIEGGVIFRNPSGRQAACCSEVLAVQHSVHAGILGYFCSSSAAALLGYELEWPKGSWLQPAQHHPVFVCVLQV